MMPRVTSLCFLALELALLLLLAGCGSLGGLAPSADQPLVTIRRNQANAPLGSPAGTAISQLQGGSPIEPFVSYGAMAEAGDVDLAEDPDLERLSVTLNFVDTDVREFARILFSELLQRPYVVDQKISGTVTLRSGGEVSGNVALSMARKALEASANSIILSDGIYRVTSARDAAGAAGSVQTFKLQHIDADAAIAAMQPMVEGRAQLLKAGTGSISARGDAETLALVQALLGTIDLDQFRSSSFGLFPLDHAQPEDVVAELTALFGGAGITGMTLVPIDRMQAVLVVVARPAHLTFAQQWIVNLDRGIENDRQIFVYDVRNREAVELATLLTEVFSDAGGTSLVTIAEPSPGAADSGLPLPSIAATSPVGGNIKVTADSGSNTLVVWATRAEFELVLSALRRLDTPLRQVFVEATIAEVRLGGELSHGVRWFLESGNLLQGVSVGAGITDTTTGAVGPSFPGFNFSLQIPQAQLVISALESYTDVRVVSAPQLTVIDRETATIQVGDQVPIVTKSVEDTNDGSSIIANDVSFRDTGVILKITPQIRSSGEVLLSIDQEVSSVVPTTSSQINSPTISQRKITSTVLVPDDTAILLGGLISSSGDEGGGGLPGTQKTLLESIFGSKRTTSYRSELIIIIRPQIIEGHTDLRGIVEEVAERMKSVIAVQ